MPKVCWTDKGEASLLSIARYVIEQNQSRQRGLDLIEKVEQKALNFATFSEAGTSHSDLGPGLRCFPVDKHLVIYRPIEDGIAVILFAHGHQDVRTVVERLCEEQTY